ncbi:MAG: hypothetical protein IBJ11_00245 [Phycisphaerales bacterium]|nr:hypothetical protein [Phycisphaerales bacterium]
MSRRTLAAALVLALSALPACQQQRASHVVRESGERAMWRSDWAAAEGEYRELVRREPGDIDDRARLARSLMKQQKFALAREHWEQIYTVKPNDRDTIKGLATSMLGSGDLQSMTAELRSGAQTRNRAQDWMLLGQYLTAAGDHDEAERALLRAAEVDKGRSLAPQYLLADFYQSVGDKARAMERYRMALSLAPNDREIQDAIRALGGVPGPTFVLTPAEAVAK